MRKIISISTLLIAAMAAHAGVIDGSVTLSGLGSGQGWNDGSYYTGYVTLTFNGTAYTGLCIDALHEAEPGATWQAIYVPLTDPSIDSVLATYFPAIAPADYTLLLEADVLGYLDMAGASEATTIDLQHEVWGQFDDPSVYSGAALAAAAVANPPGFSGFGLVIDANYVNGGTGLEQAFLIDPPSPAPEPSSTVLIGMGLIGLGLTRWVKPSRLLGNRRNAGTQQSS